MNESVLNNKRIIAVDDEPDVLEMLQEEIMSAAPECSIDTAASYGEAIELLTSRSYDLAILDVMGVRGFDLLRSVTSGSRPTAAVMLTAHAFSPESFKRSIELGALAYLPKERLGSVVPFLEDVLKYEHGYAWRRALTLLEGSFVKQWGEYWRSPDSAFWEEFEQRIADKE